MDEITLTIQGQRFSPDIGLIENLLEDNPAWGRSRLSVKLCELWDWRTPAGRLKDMACRRLLLKLERAGHIVLPPRQRSRPANSSGNQSSVWVSHRNEPIIGVLKDLAPLQISCVANGSKQDQLFRCLLSHYHYLGLYHPVGESMKYFVHSHDGRPLACLLFSAAAWKCAARDTWIGWNASVRTQNLSYVTNNTRFLILPWIKVSHLASHILSRISRRILTDWMAKYAHPLYCLETFVDSSRYRGLCYQAANWHMVGQSSGRGRNDRYHRLNVPTKDTYLYPLVRDCHARLRDDT